MDTLKNTAEVDELIRAIAARTGATEHTVRLVVQDDLTRKLILDLRYPMADAAKRMFDEFIQVFIMGCEAGVLRHGEHWRMRVQDELALLIRVKVVCKLIEPIYLRHLGRPAPEYRYFIKLLFPDYAYLQDQVKFAHRNTSAMVVALDLMTLDQQTALVELESKARKAKTL